MSTRFSSLAYDNGDYQSLNIEFNILNGFPEFNIAGAKPSISNSIRYKHKSQVLSSGYSYKPKRKVANFYPSGKSLDHIFVDVPLILGYLIQTKQFSYVPKATDLFIGEIGLDGVPSYAAITQKILDRAKSLNFKNIFVPKSNLPELINYTGLNIIGYSSIKDLTIKLSSFDYTDFKESESEGAALGFDNIVNNYYAKKMITIGVGTFSNILIIGEPGIGKTLLLNSVQNILPPPSRFYKRQIKTKTSGHPCLILDSTITKTDLLSCKSEYSLYQKSHMGVLGVNELNQISKSIREIFKTTLEQGGVLYKGNLQESRHAFIGTMNPCRCGYSNSIKFQCVCNDFTKNKYIHSLGQPFLDRFDIFIDFNSGHLPQVTKINQQSESDSARSQVEKLYKFQEVNQFFSDYSYDDLKKHLDEKARLLFEFSVSKLSMSMRRQVKTLRLSLALSVLKNQESIAADCIYEAITVQRFYYDLLKKKDVG